MDYANLLTTRQAASHAGVTWHTIRRWIINRGLPVHHVGNVRLIDRIELEQFMSNATEWRKDALTIGRRVPRTTEV